MRKLLAAVLLSLLPSLAWGQVQENIDLGNVISSFSVSAYAPAATYNSADIINSTDKGVVCFYNQVSSSGSPSVTLSIQSKDAASGLYDALVQPSAVSNGAPTYLAVYPGMQTSSLPTGWTGLSVHLPRVFRVQAVVAGSTSPGVAATFGCNLLN